MAKTDFKILIIEDEALVASDIRQTLEKYGFKIVGTADRMEKAVALFTASRPQLIICDVKIKGPATGIDVVRRLKETYKDFTVIYLTAYSDEKTLDSALRTNPDSYLVKPFTDAQLKTAVTKALHNFFTCQSANGSSPFTHRELDILALLKQGLTSREISELLSISLQTVKSHRKNMIHKTSARNITELIALSISNSWGKSKE
jgi:DNA-binding NarL/FixJ family response regulator